MFETIKVCSLMPVDCLASVNFRGNLLVLVSSCVFWKLLSHVGSHINKHSGYICKQRASDECIETLPNSLFYPLQGREQLYPERCRFFEAALQLPGIFKLSQGDKTSGVLLQSNLNRRVGGVHLDAAMHKSRSISIYFASKHFVSGLGQKFEVFV